MNSIGVNIRKVRELKGLSQENLAIELGISQPSYARLEKDDKRISITRLISIANILKVSAAELLNEKTGKINSIKEIKNYDSNDNGSITSDRDHIQTLKDEIIFLRKLLEHTTSLK